MKRCAKRCAFPCMQARLERGTFNPEVKGSSPLSGAGSFCQSFKLKKEQTTLNCLKLGSPRFELGFPELITIVLTNYTKEPIDQENVW